MKSQWREFLRYVKNRGDVPCEDDREQKEQTAYEEATKRLYELHLQAKDLFYVDSAEMETDWYPVMKDGDCKEKNAETVSEKTEKEPVTDSCQEEKRCQGRIIGEVAKGSFFSGDWVKLLDRNGVFLMEAQIADKKEEESVLKGIMKGDVKNILILVWEEGTKELFLQAQFLQKQEADEKY